MRFSTSNKVTAIVGFFASIDTTYENKVRENLKIMVERNDAELVARYFEAYAAEFTQYSTWKVMADQMRGWRADRTDEEWIAVVRDEVLKRMFAGDSTSSSMHQNFVATCRKEFFRKLGTYLYLDWTETGV